MEKYNKVRREVECPKCNQGACHRCIQRYITETIEDPHCMHCKHPFDRRFLNSQLTKTFMTHEYVEKRREILWNREESYLPGAMAFIPLIKEKKDLDSQIEDMEKTMREMQESINNFQNRKWQLSRAIDTGVLPDGKAVITDKQQKFVRRCIKEACKGWLSTAWKCDLCDTKVCSDCYQIKLSPSAANPHIIEHTCNKEDLETAEYIRKNAKNCPKCGEMIEKKDGCDQMFCTSCHTAFSWKTLEIVKGAIHNPHYFAWRQHNGINERTIGDIQCGGVPDVVMFRAYNDMPSMRIYAYDNELYMKDLWENVNDVSTVLVEAYDGQHKRMKIYPSKNYKLYTRFVSICQHLEHMHGYTQRHGRFYYDEEENAAKTRRIRLSYLSDLITKNAYKAYLATEEKKRDKLRILCQPIDTLYNAGADILRRAIPHADNLGFDLSINANKTPENYEKAFQYAMPLFEEYLKLVDFINDVYKDISYEFNMQVPYIKNAKDTMINYKITGRKERQTKKTATGSAADTDSDSDSDFKV